MENDNAQPQIQTPETNSNDSLYAAQQALLDKYGSQFNNNKDIALIVLNQLAKQGLDVDVTTEALTRITDSLRLQAQQILDDLNTVQKQAVENLNETEKVAEAVKTAQEAVNAEPVTSPTDVATPEQPPADAATPEQPPVEQPAEGAIIEPPATSAEQTPVEQPPVEQPPAEPLPPGSIPCDVQLKVISGAWDGLSDEAPTADLSCLCGAGNEALLKNVLDIETESNDYDSRDIRKAISIADALGDTEMICPVLKCIKLFKNVSSNMGAAMSSYIYTQLMSKARAGELSSDMASSFTDLKNNWGSITPAETSITPEQNSLLALLDDVEPAAETDDSDYDFVSSMGRGGVDDDLLAALKGDSTSALETVKSAADKTYVPSPDVLNSLLKGGASE